MTNERKPIRRLNKETNEESLFIATGIWADGHLAYSEIDENGNILNEEDEGMFVQVKDNNKLVMIHI